jgi:lipopolysaccharide export system protein LptA
MRVLALIAALSLSATLAVGQIVGPQVKRDEPIEIVANTLDVQQDRRTATFAGDVVAQQGVMMLKADKVQVAYGAQGGANTFERLEATGKVFISTPMETAQGNAATYEVGPGIITLTGAVVLTRGENVLRGERLVLNLANGTSRMEGGAAVGADGRVRGVFVPEAAGNPK